MGDAVQPAPATPSFRVSTFAAPGHPRAAGSSGEPLCPPPASGWIRSQPPPPLLITAAVNTLGLARVALGSLCVFPRPTL